MKSKEITPWIADEEAYDARKAQLVEGKDQHLPEAVSMLLLRGNSRLKAIRLWRGMSQTELAEKAAIGQGYLSDLENGRRAGSPDVLHALSRLLDIPPHWIAT
jgi:ribosome-binding protein aMBF1 (putative translation factor)